MRNLFIFTFLSFLFASITTTAFEDDQKNNNKKIIYKLNANLDDLVLNYCTTYDSYTVNRLYSQKKILDEKFKTNKLNKFLVSFKKKPLNPSVFKLINKESKLNIVNQNINDINLDFLSQSKKEFVKVLCTQALYCGLDALYALPRSEIPDTRWCA